MTIASLYQEGKQFLGVGAVDLYSLQAILIAFEGFTDVTDLLTHLDRTAQNVDHFHQGLRRLQAGEPVAYILNQTTFYGLTLKVNPSVLIPRQETEELVALILKRFHQHHLRIVDIGTGSGAIALALKKHRPHWQVYATEMDHQALAVAKENAVTLNLELTFMQGDGLEPLQHQSQGFDLFVSNPPYIDAIEKMDEAVVKYEPMVALLALPATKFYQQYLQQAKAIANPHAVFAFEIDPSLVASLPPIVTQWYQHAKVEFFQDINRKNRIALIYT